MATLFADDIFKCIFLNDSYCTSIQISLICSQGSNYQYARIDSDNGLVPNRLQAITRTNAADPVLWCIYVALGEMS